MRMSLAALGYPMSADWQNAAAHGVSCWDYPAGVPVWVPGPYGSNPTGTPQTGPQCWAQPVITQAPAAPAALPAPAPAPLPPPPVLPVLSPANISQPLPDISSTLEPAAVVEPSCWCILNQQISDHPLAAIGVLAVTAAILFRKKHTR